MSTATVTSRAQITIPALSWALTRPVPALGGVTPFAAITAGREADVLGYLAGLPNPSPATRRRRKSP